MATTKIMQYHPQQDETTHSIMGHPEDESVMDQLRQDRLKFICREQDIEGINNSNNNNTNSTHSNSDSSMCSKASPEPAAVLDKGNNNNSNKGDVESPVRRRKSHPWKTDVQMNRFGGSETTTTAPSSRTQKSTLGWKQRMQERKAVFGNVAVMEDTDGEEEEDDDEEESIGADEDEIQEQAHELLKNKGFQDLPPPPPPSSTRSLQQQILQQQYDDDLISVGPGESLASESCQNSHAIRLDEIQTLRQQILQNRQQKHQHIDITTLPEHPIEQESAENLDEDEEEMFPEMDENELAFYTFKKQRVLQAMMERVSACNPRGVERMLEQVVIGNAWTREQSGEQPPADFNDQQTAAWKVMHELRHRLEEVYTGDHVCVVAMGRKGLGGEEEHRPTISFDHNAFNRHKLRNAMQERVSQVYTGDHVIVTSNHDRKMEQNEKDNDNSNDENDNSFSNDDSFMNNFSSRTAASTTSSMAAAAAAAPPKSPAALKVSLKDSFTKFETLLKKTQDDDEWTECTMDVVADTQQQKTLLASAGMLPSMPVHPVTPDDDQSVYTEYTLETVDDGALPTSSNSKERSGCIEYSPEEKKKNVKNTQLAFQSIGRFFSEKQVLDDDEYTEVTIDEQSTPMPPSIKINKAPSMDSGCTNETVHPAVVTNSPVQIPGVQHYSSQHDDDQSYMEVTVQDAPLDDQSYMEFTVQESVTPFRTPPRSPQKKEFTVQAPFVGASKGLPRKTSSAYMTKMLSSRMFADMDLPPELKTQQPQQQQQQQQQQPGKEQVEAEYDDENFPTITVHHKSHRSNGFDEDDDMTQITFDHDDWEEEQDATQDHYHAQTYLDRKLPNSNNTVSNSSSGGVSKSPGSVASRRSGHTDPTDDESSSHNGGSFKSCVSTESSQSVAKLLRKDIWSRDAEVVHKALVQLGEVASEGPQHRLVISRYGGVLAIIRAMEMNQDHVTVQIAACVALEHMAQEPDTQIAIGEVGGLPAIASAMQAQMENVDLHKAACKVLANLTCRPSDQVPTDGIVESISMSMTIHGGVAEIQANAFKALANLCLESTDRLRELSSVGGLAAMTMALQKSWPNKADQHEAISTLSILLRSLAELED